MRLASLPPPRKPVAQWMHLIIEVFAVFIVRANMFQFTSNFIVVVVDHTQMLGKQMQMPVMLITQTLGWKTANEKSKHPATVNLMLHS